MAMLRCIPHIYNPSPRSRKFTTDKTPSRSGIHLVAMVYILHNTVTRDISVTSRVVELIVDNDGVLVSEEIQ